jgi:hypothetical protein
LRHESAHAGRAVAADAAFGVIAAVVASRNAVTKASALGLFILVPLSKWLPGDHPAPLSSLATVT